MKKIIKVTVLITAVIGLYAAQTPVSPTGDGSSGNPYQIASIENLYWLQIMGGSGYSIQTADIDASETTTWNSDGQGGYYGWSPINNTNNAINYDGQGYVIDGLYINRSSTNNVGLFGSIYGATKGNITDVHLTNANITGAQYTGGIAGMTSLYDISECSVHGTITGTINVGGVVGDFRGVFGQPVTMQECAGVATVTGQYYTGGLAGATTGATSGTANTTNCFSNAPVVGLYGFATGGLIGNLVKSQVMFSYASGIITGGSGGLIGNSDASGEGGSTVYFSYWDYETTGLFASAGGELKSTSQMKTQTTFTGWDFTSTWAIDGTESINNGYPYLQNISEEALPISLETFTAVYNQGRVEINWVTESEENNARFLIYRNDEVIAMIDGAGTTTEPHNYSYCDTDIVPGMTYVYKLGDVSYANELVIHDEYAVTVTISENDIPQAFALNSNYPNPFNPSTMIPFAITSNENVSLNIYDMNGKLVITLINENMTAGYHEILWDGKDNTGNAVNSGMYISKLVAGEHSDSRKMLMVK